MPQKNDPDAIRRDFFFSDNRPQQAAIICYINGIEIPMVGCSVTYGVWRYPEANIQLIPDRTLKRLGYEDRVQVQLFYLDNHFHKDNPEFCLLFDGEIVGWRYHNTPRGRTMSFQCVSHIQIFGEAYYYFLSTVNDVLGAELDPNAAVTGISQPGVFYPYSLFHQGLVFDNKTPETDSDASGASVENLKKQSLVKRPYDILINAAKALMSRNIPNKQRTMVSKNFYGRWGRTVQFANRFAALPEFEDPGDMSQGIFPILKAEGKSRALDVLQQRIVTEVGNAGTLWDVLTAIFKPVNMEIAMLPTAPCFKVSTIDGTILGPANATETSFKKELRDRIELDYQNTLEDIDAIYQDFIEKIQPTGGAATAAVTVNFPNIDAERLAPVKGSEASIAVLRDLSIEATKEARDAKISTAQSAANNVRIVNYFTKPQFYFGVAPSCNVIFPSMIDSVAFNENYKNQPTRMYVNDRTVGQALGAQGSFSGFLMNAMTVGYPEQADLALRVREKSLVSTGKNILLHPEEFFKGPSVAQIAAPPFFWFLQELQKVPDDQKLINASTPEQEREKFVRLYRLFAKYEYTRARSAQRSGGVTGVFNPYVVPGFPCAIFDQRASQADLTGYVMEVTHTFSASGNIGTQISYGFGRMLTEMFDDINTEMEENQRIVAAAPRDPVDSVADIINDQTKSEAFYRRLFYAGQTVDNKDAAFDYTKLVGVGKISGAVEPVSLSGTASATTAAVKEAQDKVTVAKAALDAFRQIGGGNTETDLVSVGSLDDEVIGEAADATRRLLGRDTQAVVTVRDLYFVVSQPSVVGYEPSFPTLASFETDVKRLELQLKEQKRKKETVKVSSNIGEDVDVRPLPDARRYFDNYDDAMHYVSRPVCTLNEYIQFLHNFNASGQSFTDFVAGLTTAGQMGPPIEVFEGQLSKNDEKGRKSAVFYERIKSYRPGPGNVSSAQQNIVDSLITEDFVGPPSPPSPVPKDFPETRKDWDAVLIAYREMIIYNDNVGDEYAKAPLT